jgi:hypothetical protein
VRYFLKTILSPFLSRPYLFLVERETHSVVNVFFSGEKKEGETLSWQGMLVAFHLERGCHAWMVGWALLNMS